MVGSILILTSVAPLMPLAPLAEERIGGLIGGEVEIDGLRLRSTLDSVELRFDSISGDGAQQFEALDGRVALTLGRLFNLQPIPRRVEVGAINAVVRGADGGEGEAAPLPIEQLLSALSAGDAGSLSLPAVNVSYQSADGSELFHMRGASIFAGMAGGQYEIGAQLPFVLADGSEVSADLGATVASDGSARLTFLSDGTPVQPLLTAFAVDAFSLESFVTGSVALQVDPAGRPLGGTFDLELSEGAGHIGESDFVIGENSLVATFSEDEPVFRIESFTYDVAGNHGKMVGEVATLNLLDPVNLVLDFDVQGQDIHVDLKNFMDGPLDIEEVGVVGTFDAAERDLFFQNLRSEFFGSELSGSLRITFPEGFSGSPRIVSDAVLPGPLTPQEVLAGWPRPLAREARKWVIENLLSGALTELKYTSDIPMGSISKGMGLKNEDMTFTFRADDARLMFLPDMPAITGLSASALVRGNSFFVDGESGVIEGVEISNARLAMPRFAPGVDVNFSARLQGELPTILSALETSSLVDLSESSYTADSFHGEGGFDLRVSWPLGDIVPEESVYIGGEGAFVRGGLDDVVPGIDVIDAGGQVVLNPEGVIIRGQGLAAQAPTEFEWRQNFKGRQNAELNVSADLDTLAADMIGVPLREFFRGEVKTNVFSDDLRPGAPLTIIGELTDAAVSIPMLGVQKSRGVEGFFETTLALPDAPADPSRPENIVLDALRLSSPSFNIEGSGTFTPEGAVVRLELPRLYIEDSADVSLRLLTDPQGIELDIEGDHINAVTAIDSYFSSDGAANALPGRMDLNLNLRRLELKNDVQVFDVAAEGQHTGVDFEQLTLTGRLGMEGAVSITEDRPPGSELAFVEVEATDFGELMNGIFGVASVSGAPGSIKGTRDENGRFDGRFEMGELIIRDAPVLARILSFTSLDGLADALSGEGIRFTKLEGDIAADGPRLELADAKLVGSSLGISAAGYVDFETGTVDVRGAFAPVFALNGFLGSVPGIGRLFVSREGEGIVAFSYSVTGSIDQPVVTVNALSALTPGILRRIFDPVPDSEDALERATGEVERQQDLSETP